MDKKYKSKNTQHIDQLANDLAADEQLAQFSVRILDEHAEHLNASTLGRLSDARGLAIQKLESSQERSAQGTRVLQWVESAFERHRWLLAVVILSAMLLTFVATQKYYADNSLEQGDAFLLASELPPEAFADKGFDTWQASR